MKIEIFASTDLAKCQNQVNHFLERCEKHQVKVLGVQFETTAMSQSDEVMYSVLVSCAGQVPPMELLDEEVS